MRLVLRRAAAWESGQLRVRDIAVRGDRVAEVGEAGALAGGDCEIDLAGRVVLPGLVNGHDHLDFSTFPPLGRPPYANVYDWAIDVDPGSAPPAVRAALAVPSTDRLFLGGLRNLLAGVTAVAHHNPYHRSLGRSDFPVRVLAKYAFAHSPGLTPHLRKTYRTTDRRIPWMVHMAEGTDARCRGELALLVEANVLRQNTVIVHGIALDAEDAARIAAAKASVVWCPESNRHLYAATAPIAMLLAAGVRVGLGSDSPLSGVRDALSNLAAARREGVLGDTPLLEMATRGTGEVARLPVGGFEPGAAADFVVVDDIQRLLGGDRRAVALVIVGGRPRHGSPSLMASTGQRTVELRIEGEPRLIDEQTGRRAAGLLKAHPAARAAPWLAELEFG